MNPFMKISLDNYCVDELDCVCKTCKKEFSECAPSDYELVCFLLENGEKRFLPTYGKYGYLDLLGRLVSDWNPAKPITESVSNQFIAELQNITPYQIKEYQLICPSCGSTAIQVMKKTAQYGRTVKWLEINQSLIDNDHNTL